MQRQIMSEPELLSSTYNDEIERKWKEGRVIEGHALAHPPGCGRVLLDSYPSIQIT